MDKKTIDDLANVLQDIKDLAAEDTPITELTQAQWDSHRLYRIFNKAHNALEKLPDKTDTQLFRALAADAAEAQAVYGDDALEAGDIEPDTWINKLADPAAWDELMNSVNEDTQ